MKRKKKNKEVAHFLKCDGHVEMKEVFSDPKTKIKVYMAFKTYNFPPNSIIVSPETSTNDFLLLKKIDDAGILDKYSPPKIIVDCPDMERKINKDFWKDLVLFLREKKKDIILHSSISSHGKAAVILCLLAHFMGVSKDDPISFIRKRFCSLAIETESHVSYIEKITGIRTKQKGSLTGKSYVVPYVHSSDKENKKKTYHPSMTKIEKKIWMDEIRKRYY